MRGGNRKHGLGTAIAIIALISEIFKAYEHELIWLSYAWLMRLKYRRRFFKEISTNMHKAYASVDETNSLLKIAFVLLPASITSKQINEVFITNATVIKKSQPNYYRSQKVPFY